MAINPRPPTGLPPRYGTVWHDTSDWDNYDWSLATVTPTLIAEIKGIPFAAAQAGVAVAKAHTSSHPRWKRLRGTEKASVLRGPRGIFSADMGYVMVKTFGAPRQSSLAHIAEFGVPGRKVPRPAMTYGAIEGIKTFDELCGIAIYMAMAKVPSRKAV